ncbi:MAG: sugar ABC transporter permease [Clostridia bacterium]|nr:sugar ABC transporter permease [Clostridia bacterium]
MEENVTATQEFAAEAVTEAVVPEKKKRKPINQQKLQDNIWGWVFCLPLIFGTVLFVYVALVMALLLSFTNYNIFSGGVWEFLGRMFSGDQSVFDMTMVSDRLQQGATYDPFYWYKYAFTEKVWNGPGDYCINNGIYVNAMGYTMFNTVFYLIGIPIGMVLSVFFAVCMSRDIKGGSVFRVLYYLPCVASTVAIIYTFKLMFGKTGVFNTLLGTDVPWIIDESYASWPAGNLFWSQGLLSKTMIVIMSVWKGLGGTIILYVAGLSGVNNATKEAAQIDGANGWTIFWKVTMPDLYPVIFYNVVTSVIGGMQIYAEPELFFTSSTQVNLYTSGYVSLIWFYGINDPRGAYASLGAAYGMILAVIIFVLTLFQFWLDSRKKD